MTTIAERVASRAAASPQNGVQWVRDEILIQKCSTGKTPIVEVAAYLHNIIKSSQEIHKLLSEATKNAQDAVSGGDTITAQDLERAIYKEAVLPAGGEDPLGKLLAKVIAHGDYVYLPLALETGAVPFL